MSTTKKTGNPVPSTKPAPATKTTPGKVNTPQPAPKKKMGGKC